MHLFVESIDRLDILAAEYYLQRTSRCISGRSTNDLKFPLRAFFIAMYGLFNPILLALNLDGSFETGVKSVSFSHPGFREKCNFI